MAASSIGMDSAILKLKVNESDSRFILDKTPRNPPKPIKTLFRYLVLGTDAFAGDRKMRLRASSTKRIAAVVGLQFDDGIPVVRGLRNCRRQTQIPEEPATVDAAVAAGPRRIHSVSME